MKIIVIMMMVVLLHLSFMMNDIHAYSNGGIDVELKKGEGGQGLQGVGGSSRKRKGDVGCEYFEDGARFFEPKGVGVEEELSRKLVIYLLLRLSRIRSWDPRLLWMLGDVVLRKSHKPHRFGRLYYACPRSKPSKQDHGCGYFKWKDEITFGNASSFSGPSTPSISSSRASSSSGLSVAALSPENAECSN
nr:hypothetical protein [Tanacetum cinerariifolium]